MSSVSIVHLNIVLGIALVSIGIGLISFFQQRLRAFFVGHAIWGIVTLLTWLALRLLLFNTAESLDTTRLVLAFSIGLDFALYPLGGLALWLLKQSLFRQLALALWTQGPFHIANSLIWLSRLNG